MDLGGGVTEYVLCSKEVSPHSGTPRLLGRSRELKMWPRASNVSLTERRISSVSTELLWWLSTCGRKIREISNETGLTDYRVEVETLQKNSCMSDSRSSYRNRCSRDPSRRQVQLLSFAPSCFCEEWSPYSPNLSSCRASFWLLGQNEVEATIGMDPVR